MKRNKRNIIAQYQFSFVKIYTITRVEDKIVLKISNTLRNTATVPDLIADCMRLKPKMASYLNTFRPSSFKVKSASNFHFPFHSGFFSLSLPVSSSSYNHLCRLKNQNANRDFFCFMLCTVSLPETDSFVLEILRTLSKVICCWFSNSSSGTEFLRESHMTSISYYTCKMLQKSVLFLNSN